MGVATLDGVAWDDIGCQYGTLDGVAWDDIGCQYGTLDGVAYIVYYTQWRSEGNWRPGAKLNFAPPPLKNLF